MNSMKKRIFSLFMSVVLCLSMLPTSVLAQEMDAQPVQATQENVIGSNVAEGNVVEGNTTEGNATEGNATEGNVADGNATEGNATEGDATDGNATGGNATDDNVIDGDATDGNATDDNVIDGDVTGGDVTEGDATDGNAIENNVVGGDAVPAVQAVAEHTDHPACGDASCDKHGSNAFTDAKELTYRYNKDRQMDWLMIDGTPAETIGYQNYVILPTGSYYLGEELSMVGSICINGDVQLCLNGKNFVLNFNQCAIKVADGATLTLCDCQKSGVITHGTSNYDSSKKARGVGILLEGNSRFIMNGGIIRDNDGGGVSVSKNAEFTMNGGTISGCSYYWGGGVCLGNGAKFTMNDGTISGNTATDSSSGNGGGVYADSATFIMNGGKIINNTAQTKGGGVSINEDSVLILSGAPIIMDNTVDSNPSNVYLPDNKTLQIDGNLTGTKSIGISLATLPTEDISVTFATGGTDVTLTDADAKVFFPDAGSDYRVVRNSKGIRLAFDTGHEHFICGGGTCTDSEHPFCGDKIWFDKWNSADSLPDEEGNWYLATDVTLSDQTWTPAAGTVLCLNGHSITMNQAGTTAIEVVSGSFTLTDCDGDKGNHTFSQKDGAGQWVPDTLGEITVAGGVITHSSGMDGSGVFVNNGTFVMYGGTICGNSSDGNGGAGVRAISGSFTMYDGIISGNESNSNGGGVYLGGSCYFTMTCGTISQNIAAAQGGGVYMDGLCLRLAGEVQIKDNLSNGQSDDLYLCGGQSIEVIGKLIGEKTIGVSVESLPAKNSHIIMGNGVYGHQLNEEDASAFFCNNDYNNDTYRIVRNGNDLWLINGEFHQHKVCTGTDCIDCGHDNAAFSLLTYDTENKVLKFGGMQSNASSGFYALHSGRWYLNENITLDAPIQIDGNVELCLNGHSIIMDADADAITISANSTFTLSDCNGSNGQYVFRQVGAGTRWKLIDHDDGTTGNITVTGGIISHAENRTGRGVFVSENGTFTMYGSAIIGNMAEATGAGVSVMESADFTMHGGMIAANMLSQSSCGGGIYSKGNVLIDGNSVVTKNSAASDSGGQGAGIWSGGTMTITGNAAVCVNSFFRSNGSSIGCSALGGGVYSNGSLSIEGDARITGNLACQAGGNGGGIYVSGGTLTLKDRVEITGNKILNSTNTNRGCGIYMASGTQLSVSGAVQVSENWDASNATIPANVFLDGENGITPIAVTGALNGASIGVTVPKSILKTIDDNNTVTIAIAETAGWIWDNSFISDTDVYAISMADSGREALLGTHAHQWVYSPTTENSAGLVVGILTATCGMDGCNVEGGMVNISGFAKSFYNGNPKPVTLDNQLTTGAVVSAITYKVKNGEKYETLDSVPTDAGSYIAEITVEGVNVEIAFEIGKAWLVAGDFNFQAPDNAVYNGNSWTAAVTPVEGLAGCGEITVYYESANDASYSKSTLAPRNAGSYKVSIYVTEGSNYNATVLEDDNWTFTIGRADYSMEVPETWNQRTVIDGSTVGTVFTAMDAYTTDILCHGVNNEQFTGFFVWYRDSECTTDVRQSDTFDGVGTTVTLYRQFYFNQEQPNYTLEPKIGSTEFVVVEGAKQNLSFRDAGGYVVSAGTRTYGDVPSALRIENNSRNGGAITYTSSVPTVATVDADTGVITLCNVGKTIITATAAMVPGIYAETTATYELTVKPKTLDISDLEVTGGSLVKPYDGTDSADITMGVKPGVLVSDDTLTIRGTARYNSANVMDAVEVFFTPEEIATGNYYLAGDEAKHIHNAHITPVTITVTPEANQSKTYGMSDPELTYTATDAVNGETPAFAGKLGREAGNDVGTYAINRGTLVLKNNENFIASNYELVLSTPAVDFTISKAVAPVLADIMENIRYTYSGERTVNLAQLVEGTTGYAMGTASGNEGFISTPSVDANGVLKYTLNGTGAAGDTVTLPVTIFSNNYEEATVKVIITLNAKDEQEMLSITGGTTVVYGQTLKLGTRGGSGTGAVTYSVINGTGEATIDAEGKLTPLKVGVIKVQATKAEDARYNDIKSAEVEVTITKATPTGKPRYTKITRKAKTLADAKLKLLGSTIKLPGQILWVAEDGVTPLDDSTIVEAQKSYTWLFIPTDSVNYTTLTGSVVLYRMSSGDDDDSNGAGGGGAGYTANSSYIIEATTGGNGSISPAGATTIREGSDQTYTITPDKGYAIAKVLVDGSSVGAVTTYTFKNVQGNHTIQVVFMKANGNPQTGVSVDAPEDGILE